MTTTAKLRWGILGVARINDRLLPGFARAARADLRAIASRSPDRAREAARAAGIATAHGSYEELLADPAELERLLARGAERARELSAPTLERMYEVMGFVESRTRQ